MSLFFCFKRLLTNKKLWNVKPVYRSQMDVLREESRVMINYTDINLLTFFFRDIPAFTLIKFLIGFGCKKSIF